MVFLNRKSLLGITSALLSEPDESRLAEDKVYQGSYRQCRRIYRKSVTLCSPGSSGKRKGNMLWGIILSLLTGVSFIMVGALYSYAGNQIRMIDAMLVYNWILVAVLLPFCRTIAAVPWGLSLLMVFTGAINIAAMLLLQKAMVSGNSGIAWAIGQSALVGPFICGMLFFGETPSLARIAGALTIVCGMLLLGFAKSGARRAGSSWLKLAFGAFLILALAQSLVSASSCWSYPMSGLERACCMSFGGGAALLAVKLAQPKRIEFSRIMRIIIAMLAITGLASLLLTFAALDQLAKVSLAGIGYPIMLGSCIVGFALYSALALKEKIRPLQWGAIMAIVFGIILLSTP